MGIWGSACREMQRSLWLSGGIGLVLLLVAALATLVAVLTTEVSRSAAESLEVMGTQILAFSPAGPEIPVGCGPHGCPTEPAAQPGPPPEARVPGEGPFLSGWPSRLLQQGFLAEVAGTPRVKQISTILSLRFLGPRPGEQFAVVGYDPADAPLVQEACATEEDLIWGRLLQPGERGAAMVNHNFLHQQELGEGDPITVSGRELAVVGVLVPSGRLLRGDVYVTLPQAQELAQGALVRPAEGAINGLLVQVTGAEAYRVITARLRSFGLMTSSTMGTARVAQVHTLVRNSLKLLLLLVAVLGALICAAGQMTYTLGRLRALPPGEARDRLAGINRVAAEALLLGLSATVVGGLLAVGAMLLTPLLATGGVELATSLTFLGLPWKTLGILLAVLFAGGLVLGMLPPLAVVQHRAQRQAAAQPEESGPAEPGA